MSPPRTSRASVFRAAQYAGQLLQRERNQYRRDDRANPRPGLVRRWHMARLHHQTWTATSPATLTFLNGIWNDAFSGITRANELLDALRNARGRDQAIIAAEARTLRAFYYYQLMDMFGGVPIFTTPQ